MAQPLRIEPDLQFIEELQAVGGESLKKCYQCATCSVVCPISPADDPYPRKEMIWAQWGLKDKLESDIDIWLCHNCSTCSEYCPRGAKPGDLMAAMRNRVYKKLTWLNFIGAWMSSPKYLPILIGIPAVFYFIIWSIRAAMLGTYFPLFEGRVIYGKLFPEMATIDPIFVPIVLFVALTFFMGIRKLFAGFSPQGTVVMVGEKPKSWLRAFAEAVGEILAHKKFDDCGNLTRNRKFGHMFIFYGFIMLFIVTSCIATGFWAGLILTGHPFPPLHTPLATGNPVKILGIIGALTLLSGLTIATARRRGLEEKKTSSSYYDWYLLGVIWAVALTGTLSMLLRWANVPYLAYPVYFIHLCSVFMLFFYLPWSKLGHLVYRTAAITYVKRMGRRPM